MPLVCAICRREIQPNTPVILKEDDLIVHQPCDVFALAQTNPMQVPQPVIHIPHVEVIGPVEKPPPEPHFFCARCGLPNPISSSLSCRRCYKDLCPACTTAGCCGSRPAQRGEKTYCVECEKPCKSMCPYCRKYVHGGYGLSGTCSLEHEASCPAAAAARNSSEAPPIASFVRPLVEKKMIYDVVGWVSPKKPRRPKTKKRTKKAARK